MLLRTRYIIHSNHHHHHHLRSNLAFPGRATLTNKAETVVVPPPASAETRVPNGPNCDAWIYSVRHEIVFAKESIQLLFRDHIRRMDHYMNMVRTHSTDYLPMLYGISFILFWQYFEYQTIISKIDNATEKTNSKIETITQEIKKEMKEIMFHTKK